MNAAGVTRAVRAVFELNRKCFAITDLEVDSILPNLGTYQLSNRKRTWWSNSREQTGHCMSDCSNKVPTQNPRYATGSAMCKTRTYVYISIGRAHMERNSVL